MLERKFILLQINVDNISHQTWIFIIRVDTIISCGCQDVGGYTKQVQYYLKKVEYHIVFQQLNLSN